LPGGCAALKLGNMHGIPVVFTEHSGRFSMHLKTKSQRSLARNLLPKFDRVISVSPSLSNQIQSFCPLIDINTVGNVIRTDFFKSADCISNFKIHQKPQFLCIAFLKENKGIHYFIKAISSLVNRGITSFDVIIGGDGPARAKLENMLKDLGLSDLCSFLGFLTHQEVRYWMQRCDVFVLPSLSETFGVVLGEAMACGKPVIATRCGGPEFLVLPETGLLVDVADSDALADAMYKFINKQVKFDSCLIRKSISDRFGENAFLSNISKIYEQLWNNPT
jgi:glycosyltransferase involved in cell wall biosynthesis